MGLFAIYWFGWRALFTMFLCVGSAVVTEYWVQRFRKVEITCWDGSAVLTGLLFAYVMPANQPWYVSVFGSAFAIGIAKHAFGGLGNNIWNPALIARAFVLAAWPAVTILIPAHNEERVIELAESVGVEDSASVLMSQLGTLLLGKGVYAEAEPLFREALALSVEVAGGVAVSSNPPVGLWTAAADS